MTVHEKPPLEASTATALTSEVEDNVPTSMAG